MLFLSVHQGDGLLTLHSHRLERFMFVCSQPFFFCITVVLVIILLVNPRENESLQVSKSNGKHHAHLWINLL